MLQKLTPVIATAMLTLAQMPPEPDFSGDWKLVSPVPPGVEAAAAMTVVQPVTRADVYGKPINPFFAELLVTREYATGPRTERHLIGATGGTVSGAVPGGQSAASATSTQHSVRWQGRTLVLESSRYIGPASAWREWDKRREEWSFDEQGRLRIVVTTETSERSETSSVTLIYQRR